MIVISVVKLGGLQTLLHTPLRVEDGAGSPIYVYFLINYIRVLLILRTQKYKFEKDEIKMK